MYACMPVNWGHSLIMIKETRNLKWPQTGISMHNFIIH